MNFNDILTLTFNVETKAADAAFNELDTKISSFQEKMASVAKISKMNSKLAESGLSMAKNGVIMDGAKRLKPQAAAEKIMATEKFKNLEKAFNLQEKQDAAKIKAADAYNRKIIKQQAQAAKLKKKSFFELIGFSINANYVMSHVRSTKTNPISQEDLEALFIHAWGSPKLLYKHKKLPMLVIVGADIQLDESILDEMEDNSEITKVIGITG